MTFVNDDGKKKKKKTKKQKNDDESTEQFVIKCALGTFLRKGNATDDAKPVSARRPDQIANHRNKVLELINQDMRVVSALMREASLLAKQTVCDVIDRLDNEERTSLEGDIDYFNSAPQIYDRFFKPLVKFDDESEVVRNCQLDEKYGEFRNKHGLQFYIGTLRTQQILYAANQFTTAFCNNIWMHAKTRITHWLKHLKALYAAQERPEQISEHDIDNSIDYLFYATSIFNQMPCAALHNEMRRVLKHDGRFLRLKSNWFQFVPIFIRLSKYNAAN